MHHEIDLCDETDCCAGGSLCGVHATSVQIPSNRCVKMHGLGPDVPPAPGIEASVAWRRAECDLDREGPSRRNPGCRVTSVLIKPWGVQHCHV